MRFESILPLLPLLSFHAVSLGVFIACVLLSIKKKAKIPCWDLSLYLFTFLVWGAGFYLSDACGTGFGKTLSNLAEIYFIGILMLIYMLTKFIYLICSNAAIPRKMTYFMAAAVILASFLTGVLVPGFPE